MFALTLHMIQTFLFLWFGRESVLPLEPISLAENRANAPLMVGKVINVHSPLIRSSGSSLKTESSKHKNLSYSYKLVQ